MMRLLNSKMKRMRSMEKINDGGPAFAGWHLEGQYGTVQWSEGMSLRDYFAGKALMGLLNNGEARIESESDRTNGEILAVNCYFMADCMLKAREITKP